MQQKVTILLMCTNPLLYDLIPPFEQRVGEAFLGSAFDKEYMENSARSSLSSTMEQNYHTHVSISNKKGFNGERSELGLENRVKFGRFQLRKLGNLVDVVYYIIAPVFNDLFDLFQVKLCQRNRKFKRLLHRKIDKNRQKRFNVN